MDLKLCAKGLGLKQKHIAANLGVSEGTISKWLNRNEVIPTIYLLPLARMLEIEVTDLLPEESNV